MDLSFYKGKKVLLTGHTGFKGSWMCRILSIYGADVIGYSLVPPTDPSLYGLAKIEKDVCSIIGDIRDLDSLGRTFEKVKPEIVIHMAAQPIVRDSYKDPVNTYETNVMGTVNVLECVRKTESVRSFLNVTTDKVYENKEWIWGYRENENLCGFDPYSNSKSCSELITFSYKNSFLNQSNSPAVSTARSGNVIGGGDFANDRIIPDCVKSAIERKSIIVRNPYSTRPYQHVLECLGGYLLLAQKQFENKKFEGNYNFGPDDSSCISTSKLVDIFCKEWGEDLKWENHSDNGPHEASFLKLDCSKSKAILGWQPKWNIEMAIQKTVEFSKLFANKKDISQCLDEQIKSFYN